MERARALAVAFAVLAIGCGDFSNDVVDDLSFVQALPRADELRLAAPAADEEGESATADGLGTHRSALRICSRLVQEEPICAGVRLAHDINTVTAAVLVTLDAVRSLPPSERERHRRVWGPFPDERRRDREARVVIEREEGSKGWDYRWRVDVRARGGGEWIPLIEGSFRPGRRGAASRGVGHFAWQPASARAAGLEARDSATRLEIRYDLRGPFHIEADADFDDADLPTTIAFAQDVATDGSGTWAYEYPWDVDGTGDPDHIEVRARWRSDRAGRSDARLTLRGSPLAGPFGSETCWDERLERVYFRSDDPRQCAGGVCPEGDEALCPFSALF